MAEVQGVSLVSIPGIDQRLRIFRREFHDMAEFAGMIVDAYVVLTTRYVVVFDTFFRPEDAKIMLETLQPESENRQILVINSHADWDHAWGNVYFTGEHAAPIIAHAYGKTRLQSREMQQELTEFQSKYALFQSAELIAPTITFEDHLTIDGGDLSINLFPAPGHQTDHIAAWIPELKLLLAFDAIESPVPGILNAESVVPMMETLEHFLRLNPGHVLCSHSPTATPERIQANLTYLHEIERRCHACLEIHSIDGQDTTTPMAHLINYPFDEVAETTGQLPDQAYYEEVHEHNIRCFLHWLSREHPTKQNI